MESSDRIKILFVINPFSGKQTVNWAETIESYFKKINFPFDIFVLKKRFTAQEIADKIELCKPDQVVAVGGDGTVNIVAECLIHKNIILGILPAGSANGLAKELGISENHLVALNTIISGIRKQIHVIKINGRICIHLSDIGFNAWMIKKFQSDNIRGFWGYFKANFKIAWRLLFLKSSFKIKIILDDKEIDTQVSMVVVANAKKYGSGAVINPTGDLSDKVFEVILIKKISVLEVFKMLISHSSFNLNKTAVLKAKNLEIKLLKKIHFQIDGEYLGKIDEINAEIFPAAIEIMVPQ